MTPKDNPFSDEPAPKSPDSRKKDAKIENVVDELRQVLAGLGQGEPEPLPAEEPFTPHENELIPGADTSFRKDAFNPEPNEQKSDVSDAEFWKGNVLGWPSEPNGNSFSEPMDPAPSNGDIGNKLHTSIEPLSMPPPPPAVEAPPIDPR